MKKFFIKIGIVGLIITFVIASFSFLVQAEKKKISGVDTVGPVISQTVASPGNTPNHQIVLRVVTNMGTSTDPDLGNFEQTAYELVDEVAGSGTHRGYGNNLHKNGDRTYGQFEGTHKTTVKEDGSWEATWEGTWKFVGGTGKFKNIKGGGTYKGKATPTGGTTTWEGEVEY